jgi:hypothetical protein
LTYSELSREIEQFSHRDKFRLAQLLIQLALKEEENRIRSRGRKVVHQPSSTQSRVVAFAEPNFQDSIINISWRQQRY